MKIYASEMVKRVEEGKHLNYNTFCHFTKLSFKYA